MLSTAQVALTAENLVMVVLVSENQNGPMPTYRIRDLPEVARQLQARRIRAAKLFCSAPADAPFRDLRSGELMAEAIAELKAADPQLTVMTETCLCSYSENGECHLLDSNGQADVPRTI